MVWFVVACFVVASLWDFVNRPVKSYQTLRVQARPIVEAIEPANMPQGAASYFAQIVAQLEAEGFQVMGSLKRPNAVNNVCTYTVLMLNSASGDQASLIIAAHEKDHALRAASKTIVFDTRFESGERFSTANIKTPGVFRYGAKDINTRLPTTEDARLIYQIHCWVMSLQHPTSAKVTFEQHEAVPHYIESIIESYEKQVSFGRFSKDPSGDFYRPTWKGAFLMTWPLLYPLKDFYLWQIKRREQTTLQAFHAVNHL